MLQRLLMVISVGAALAVLVVLVIRTQSEPQTLQGHLGRMTVLAQLGAADAETDVQIARARLSLEAAPAGLSDSIARLEAARAGLAVHRDGLRTVSREVGAALSELLRQIDEKQTLLASYRGQLGEFGASYRALREQAEALLIDPALSGEAVLRGTLRRLIEEVTAYSLQSAPTNQADIEGLLTALPRDSGASSALRRRVLSLGSTAARVLGDKDRVKGTADKLAAVPTAATLQKLQKSYTSHFTRIEAGLARYRLVLAVYAGALLAVFGFVGWRLRRSHADLQDVNAHLEETVQARTGELRKALDDLRFQQAQLIQSEKMAALGQMVAGVAHEINTPLGYARGNVQTLRESLPMIREVLDAVQSGDEARSMEALRRWSPEEGLAEFDMLLGDADYGLGEIGVLVMGLKDFSRVDRSLTESFNLNEGLDTTLKICQSQLKNRIEVRREYSELPLVQCAPSQINQVFVNLINNATQAIEGEGVITLRTAVEDDEAVVEVRDSGCGMDDDTLAHIFEPFFTTKPVGQGTGLGLSIVFKIIEDHGGRIEVDSTPGAGTTFRVRLPLTAQPMAAPASATPGNDPAMQEAFA